jgi:hypothetical protein
LQIADASEEFSEYALSSASRKKENSEIEGAESTSGADCGATAARILSQNSGERVAPIFGWRASAASGNELQIIYVVEKAPGQGAFSNYGK